MNQRDKNFPGERKRGLKSDQKFTNLLAIVYDDVSSESAKRNLEKVVKSPNLDIISKLKHNINTHGINDQLRSMILGLKSGEIEAKDIDTELVETARQLVAMISSDLKNQSRLNVDDILPHITETWKTRDKSKKEKIPDFISRVYSDFLGKGLTRAHLKKIDKSLYFGLNNWLKNNELPKSLDLPKTHILYDADIKPTPAELAAHRKVAALLVRGLL